MFPEMYERMCRWPKNNTDTPNFLSASILWKNDTEKICWSVVPISAACKYEYFNL